MRSLTTYRRPNALLTDVDRFIDDFFSTPAHRSSSWVTPPSDVVEREDRYLVRMDLPGVQKGDITITVENGSLLIKGTRASEERSDSDNEVRLERFRGEFARSFTLGDRVDPDKITAKLENGVLEVSVPKAETAKARLIEVK